MEEPQANGDYLAFLSPEYRSDFDMNIITEDDFSEPTSGLSVSPPSSPEMICVSFAPDSLLSTDQITAQDASPIPGSPSVDSVMVDEAAIPPAIDYTAALDLIDDDLEEDDDTSSAKRSRKRRKSNDEEPIEVPPLANIPIPDPEEGHMLTREHLLALSSQTFEDYIRKLQATRDVTSEEKKEIKRQRRLIKNRESAQASRQRKKSYLDKLEQKVAAISSVNAQLREQLTAMQTANRGLTSENKSLKDQVARLQNALHKNNLSSLIDSGTKLVAAANADPHSGSGASKIGSHTRAAGVCLLVLLFSFGLLFPQLQRGNSPFSSSTGENFGTVGRLDKGESYQLASSNQPLPEILAEQNFNTQRLSEQYGQRFKDEAIIAETTVVSQPPASPVSSTDDESSLYDDNSAALSEDDLPPRRYVGEAKRKRSELTSMHETAETYTQMSAVEVGGEEMLNATQVPRLDVPAITEWSKNTTYLLCDNIKHMTPALVAAAGGKQMPTVATVETSDNSQANESFVAFYVPPDFASNPRSSSSSPKGSGDTQFMELICKVVAVDMVPAIRKMGRLVVPSLPLVEATA